MQETSLSGTALMHETGRADHGAPPQTKTLRQLYHEHKGKASDKWSLYLTEYERQFSPFRMREIAIFEIGIQNGGSLELWSKYFGRATRIVGCDIDGHCAKLQYEDPRISVVVGNANARRTRREVLKCSNGFDIIIDDGSHRSKDVISSFASYFSCLNQGGLYILEDLHCSYWKEFTGGLYSPGSSLSFFKLLVDVINREHWGIDRTRIELLRRFEQLYHVSFTEETLREIHSLEFINSLCIIRKQDAQSNHLGARVVVGTSELIEPILHLNGTLSGQRDQSDNKWAIIQDGGEDELLRVEISAQTALAQRDAALDKVKGRLEVVTAELDAAKVSLVELDAAKVSLVEKVADCTRQHDSLKEALRQARQQLASTDAQLTSAQAERSEFENALREARQQLSSTDAQLTSALAERGEFENALRDTRQQLSSTDAQLTSALVERGEFENAFREARQQLSSTDAQLNSALAERSEFENALLEAQQQLASTNTELFSAQRQVAQQHQDRLRERHELEEKLIALKGCLDAITQSTAWRITRLPLAVLSRLPRSVRWSARRIVKAAYWAATPWKMPARVRFLRHRARQSAIAETPGQNTGAKELKIASPDFRHRIESSGLFDPKSYLEMNQDLRPEKVDPWKHFLEYGIREGRRFTTPNMVARALSRRDLEIKQALRAASQTLLAEKDIDAAATPLVSRCVKIGVYCNSHGNFFMQDIANLVQWQLEALKIDAQLRTEESDIDEYFDIRVFVAPHEFFWLGQGEKWKRLVSAPGTVLFNVEQIQTPWFCRAFPFLIEAPLVMDINLQTSILLRHLGCNAIHYMPPYLPRCTYTSPQLDVSHIPVVKGYDFSRTLFDWTAETGVSSRPIDILFVGTGSERRLKAIERLRSLTDRYRFVCIYTHQTAPLTSGNYRTTSPGINCALSQRSKIVLNIHRDWLGYFEWSRMVMQGFWQGACVVSDPCLADPIFQPGHHFLEENLRHMSELLHWLLGTQDGRRKMGELGEAGRARACSPGARAAMVVPMLNSLTTSVSELSE